MISAELATTTNNVCSTIACIILIARLLVARFQPKPLDLSFFICAIGLAAIIARIPVTYYILKYGTASDLLAKMKTNPDIINHTNLDEIRIGSILSLTTRMLLTTILWTMNLLLLLLYRRFVSHLPWMHYVITASWIFILLSYIGVVLATFLECRPFSLWWQFRPSPGTCVKAYVQTLVQCVSNMLTDSVLMVISIPLLFMRHTTMSQKLRMGGLISLGLFAIVVTSLRVVYIFAQGSMQSTRSFWGGISLLAATIVANAPVLYGSIKLIRRAKNRSNGYDSKEQHSGERSGSAKFNLQLKTIQTDNEEGLATLKQTVVTVERAGSDEAVGRPR